MIFHTKPKEKEQPERTGEDVYEKVKQDYHDEPTLGNKGGWPDDPRDIEANYTGERRIYR